MIVNTIVKTILSFTKRERSVSCRVTALIGGGTLFLLIIPSIFTGIGMLAERVTGITYKSSAVTAIAYVAAATGLALLLWSVTAQWRRGHGTPAPVAPTDTLVISGPYKYCRNPIELGAIFYYFWFGTAASSAVAGITASAAAFIIGSLYHKFIEEKELEKRFGEEYIEYRKKTPFIIPKIW